MSDIHIRRTHQLGFGRARAVARQWAEQIEREFDIEARLGFFFWSFRTAIEDGIVSRLDALLASESRAKRVVPPLAKSAVAMVRRRVKKCFVKS